MRSLNRGPRKIASFAKLCVRVNHRGSQPLRYGSPTFVLKDMQNGDSPLGITLHRLTTAR